MNPDTIRLVKLGCIVLLLAVVFGVFVFALANRLAPYL